MNRNINAVKRLLVVGVLATASPALAQYRSPPPPTPAPAQPTASASTPAPTKQFNISKQVRKELVDLQTAVNAKDTATIPAKLAAAQAKAKTGDDRYLIAQLQLKAAVDSNNMPEAAAALELMLASGSTPPADLPGLHESLGKIHYNAKTYDKAASAFEQVLQHEPNNVDTMVMLAETRNAQGRVPDAVAMIQRAITTRSKAG